MVISQNDAHVLTTTEKWSNWSRTWGTRTSRSCQFHIFTCFFCLLQLVFLIVSLTLPSWSPVPVPYSRSSDPILRSEFRFLDPGTVQFTVPESRSDKRRTFYEGNISLLLVAKHGNKFTRNIPELFQDHFRVVNRNAARVGKHAQANRKVFVETCWNKESYNYFWIITKPLKILGLLLVFNILFQRLFLVSRTRRSSPDFMVSK